MATSSKAEARWRERIREQEASGLSVREFAQRRGLSAASLYWWRSKLGRHRCVRSPVRLAQVTVVGGESSRVVTPERIEVVLSKGRRLLLSPGFDAESVRELVVVLERC